MKAVYLNRHGSPEVLEYGELPEPVAGPGEVLVDIRYGGMNHLDLWVRRGLPHLKHAYPLVLGGDASGVVRALGPGASGVKVGDEVIVHPGISCGRCPRCLSGWESLCPGYGILGETRGGTQCERIAVPAANCFAKPKNLSFPQAAAVGLVFTTAWQMVVARAQVKPGETVLVHSAGSGVGSAAAQIARLYGARVIGTVGSSTKVQSAREWVDEVVEYSDPQWGKALRKLCPDGVDVVIDHLGKDHWGQSLKAMRWGGRLVTCGATSGFDAQTDLRQIFFRQLSLLGSTMGSKGDFPTLLNFLEQGKLKAVVGAEFPLSEAAQAHRALEGRQVFGKVVLKVS